MRCRGRGLWSGVWLPHSGLAPGHEGWGRKCRVSRGQLLSNCDQEQCEKMAAGCIMWVWPQVSRYCDGSKYPGRVKLWQMTEYQGLLLMSEPIETNIYSLYHWQLPGYWIYGQGKNLLCFKIMTRPPGAGRSLRSGHWIIAAWKSVFVTCL